LYKDHIPRLEYQYFEDRNCVMKEEAAKKLPQKYQDEIKIIRALCCNLKVVICNWYAMIVVRNY